MTVVLLFTATVMIPAILVVSLTLWLSRGIAGKTLTRAMPMTSDARVDEIEEGDFVN